MAGLNLIQEYSSDSDEETEKVDKENKAFSSARNTNLKLPLPQSIKSWKGVVHHQEVFDDPSQHEGRIRSFKHERGNWATLVYLNYIPSDEMLLWLKSIIQTAGTGNLFEEFHVSLTRTLILKFHWIDSFIEAVKNIAESYHNFMIELSNIKVYCNEDKTRTFMGITIQSTSNSLQGLTQAFDKLVDEYHLPKFYEDPSYHISFLWCLGDQRKKLETLLPSLTTSLHDFLVDQPQQRFVQIDNLKCKVGNRLYNFNLR